jgi:hypothetical protein
MSQTEPPCIVPVHGFAGVTPGTEAVLITRYMENGSHTDVLGRVTAGNLPSFWTPHGLGLLLLELFVDLGLFIGKDLFIEI